MGISAGDAFCAMDGWNYLHRIEYRREVSRSQRVLEYTQIVEDQGWCLSYPGDLRTQWLTTYTRACAEDYLSRRLAPAGFFVVTVYRQLSEDRVLVCAVRMKWGGAGRR
jgi:hypothetical protein